MASSFYVANQLFARACKLPLLTADETATRIAAAQKGDRKAEEELVMHNMRHIIKQVNRFKKLAFALNVDMNDLYAEGATGFAKAVRRFDASFKTKITTFSVWWIRHMVMKELHRNLPVYMSIHLLLEKFRIDKVIAADLLRFGTVPEDADLAERANVDPEHVTDLRNTPLTIASLNAPVNGKSSYRDHEADFIDYIADPEGLEYIEEVLDHRSRREAMFGKANELEPVETRILECRFVDGKSLVDTASIIFEERLTRALVTRERIRQIQNRAIEKLKKRLGKAAVEKMLAARA